MKTRIAMLISVAGVLAAGSVAALVNTQVLGGSASSPLSVDSPSQTVASTTPVTAASAPAVTAPAVTTPVTNAPAPVSTQAVYAIGDAGTVTLDTANDVLTIVAVTPAQGWIVNKSETDGATNAEVKFQSGNLEIEFRANLLFGVVTTSVESNDTSVTSSSVDDHGGGSDSGRHGGGESDDHGGGSDD